MDKDEGAGAGAGGDEGRDRFGRDRRRRERSRSRSRSRSASPGRRRKGDRDDRRDRGDRDRRRDGGGSRTVEELLKEPGLVSLSQFLDAQGLREDAETTKKYEDYKLEHAKKAAKSFYEDHKNETWFRERYHPAQLELRRTDKIFRVEQATKDFTTQIAAGTLTPNLIEEAHPADAPEKIPEVSTCVFIKNIAPNVARADLKKALSYVEGAPLVRLRIADPMQSRGWVRQAWAVYESEAAADKVITALATEKLNGVELAVEKTKDPDAGRKPRVAPHTAGEESRIAADLELAKQLTRRLCDDLVPTTLSTDILAAVEGAPAATPVVKLDLLITYLRQVHSMCFYCEEQYEDDEELRRRCGPVHVRGKKKDNAILPDPPSQQWAVAHESKIKALIVAPDQSSVQLGKEVFNVYAYPVIPHCARLWDTYVVRLDDKKWQCKICGKMFMGAEFVRKHLTLKHTENQRETLTKAHEEQFLINCATDPSRLGHTPLVPPLAPLGSGHLPPHAHPHPHPRNDRRDNRRDFRDRGDRGHGRGRDHRDLNKDDPNVRELNHTRGPLRSYVDLDAPTDDFGGMDFHTALACVHLAGTGAFSYAKVDCTMCNGEHGITHMLRA